MRLTFLSSFVLAAIVVTAAASCGAKMCTPQNCADGCCSADGTCQSGAENASCGTGGNVCVNCADSLQVCGNKVCVAFNGTGGGSGGGTGTGGGSATGGGGGSFVCNRTPVECSDQAIQELDLKMPASTRSVTSLADGAGGFKSTIDATAGGFTPTESYVYVRFTATGLETVSVGDVAALDSMDWDMAFRRFVIRVNSGDSGPSCVAGQAMPVGTTYDSVTAVPSGFAPEVDDFLARTTCTFIPDGSGLTTSPNTLLAPFYNYTSCVSMTNRVFVLQTQTGKHVKLVITGYYATEAAQTSCNDTGSSNMTPGGSIRMHWAYLD